MEQIKVSVNEYGVMSECVVDAIGRRRDMPWVGVVDVTADFVNYSHSTAAQAEPRCDGAKPITRQVT